MQRIFIIENPVAARSSPQGLLVEDALASAGAGRGSFTRSRGSVRAVEHLTGVFAERDRRSRTIGQRIMPRPRRAAASRSEADDDQEGCGLK